MWPIAPAIATMPSGTCARHHVDDGGAGAAIRHVYHVDRRKLLEDLERQVTRTAVAGRGVVELAGVVARGFEELGEGLEIGAIGCAASTFGEYIDSDTGAKSRLGSYGTSLNSAGLISSVSFQTSSVVPSGSALATAGPDVAGAARPVVDDHALRPALGQALRQDARQRIEAAARRRRHDETDLFRRHVLLRVRTCDPGQQNERCRKQGLHVVHPSPPRSGA